MNYETAKKLKDAGFPQPKEGIWLFPPEGSMSETDRMRNVVYQPSLSELIKSCGDEFIALEAIHAVGVGLRIESFKAHAFWNNLETAGLTPEEAVANLWLALNKKD